LRPAQIRRLTGVGMGPGDPELVTLKAVRAIDEADVVFAPIRRPGSDSAALRCARAVASLVDKSVVTFAFPGDNGDWMAIARQVAQELGSRARGVMLVEGDPTLFSSFGHLAAALSLADPSVEIKVVPGVTSVTACAAAGGLSLGQREDCIAVVPATAGPGRLEAALRSSECTVVLKAGADLGAIIDAVGAAGRLDDAVYISRCSQPDEYISRDISRAGNVWLADYWSTVIVGGRRR
jgi:precorrin-2 C(20)-methyltransferase